MDRTEQHSKRYGSTGAFLGKQTEKHSTKPKENTKSDPKPNGSKVETRNPNQKKSKKD